MKRMALCLPVLLAGTAQAQDSFDLSAAPAPEAPPPFYANYAEVGLGYQSADSFHVGRYGGVTDKGLFPILKGSFVGGDPWQSGTHFWDAAVNVYGLDTVSIQARNGSRGSWRMGVSYDAFVRAISDSAKTPFFGAGTDRLTLPASWVTGASSLQFATLNASAKPVDLAVTWRSVGGDFVITPLPGYELRLQLGYRNRDGIRPQSFAFGQEGNFAVGVFFPLPIDYDSHRAGLTLSYADLKFQWSLGYTASRFSSHTDSVIVPNPYSRSLSSAPGMSWPAGAFAGYPLAIGQFALPPDSAAHQVIATGGYALTPKTRLTARLSYTLQTQNDTYLPYTANPGLTVRDPLPRTSLDGKTHKTHLAVGLTSREWKDIDLAANYTFDARRNLSPVDAYSYVGGDVQDQVTPVIAGNSRYIRLNLPHDFTFQQIKAEAGYRLAPRTRVSLVYTGDFQTREDQQVVHTREHSLRAKVQSTFEVGTAWLSGAYAARDGSNYNSAVAWDLTHTKAYLNSSPTARSIEQPLMRKYNMADRRRGEMKGGATFDATQALVFSVSGGWSNDDYLRSPIGLTSSHSLTMDGDVSYVLAKTLTASLFYGFERIRANENGYLIFDTVSGNPDRNWAVRNLDTVHSASFKLDWQVAPKFKLDSSYTLSDGTSRTRVQSSQNFLGTVSSPLPAARDITHTADLSGNYAFKPDLALRLGYTVTRHTSRDWQYANMGLAPVAQILGSGITPPRYTVHVVWLSTRYQF